MQVWGLPLPALPALPGLVVWDQGPRARSWSLGIVLAPCQEGLEVVLLVERLLLHSGVQLAISFEAAAFTHRSPQARVRPLLLLQVG